MLLKCGACSTTVEVTLGLGAALREKFSADPEARIADVAEWVAPKLTCDSCGAVGLTTFYGKASTEPRTRASNNSWLSDEGHEEIHAGLSQDFFDRLNDP